MFVLQADEWNSLGTCVDLSRIIRFMMFNSSKKEKEDYQ